MAIFTSYVNRAYAAINTENKPRRIAKSIRSRFDMYAAGSTLYPSIARISDRNEGDF